MWTHLGEGWVEDYWKVFGSLEGHGGWELKAGANWKKDWKQGQIEVAVKALLRFSETLRLNS